MATTKKATAKTADAVKETETKKTAASAKKTTAAKKTAETAVEKKAPVKKAPAKKAVPKKVAPKKPAETKVNFFVEFGGAQVSVEDVINNVKTTLGKEAKEISVYLKPEESKAYFVADGEEKEMDVFFC